MTAAVLAVGLLAGCADDDDSGGAAHSPTPDPAAAAAPAAAEPEQPAGRTAGEAPGSEAPAAPPAVSGNQGTPSKVATGTGTPAPAGATGTATPAPAPAAAAGEKGPSKASSTPTSMQPMVRSREIRIFAEDNDEGEGPFDPRLTRVFPETLIRWVNLDTVPRSVQAVDGEFGSPLIPPGGYFDFMATELGLIEYFDGTRPTVRGALHVV